MDASALVPTVVDSSAVYPPYVVAAIAAFGAVAGAGFTVLGNLLLHWLQGRRRSKLDEQRKAILKQMLRDDKCQGRWRRLETLSRVIGSDRETTKGLLIELGARGSEKEDDLWGLLEYHPLTVRDQ